MWVKLLPFYIVFVSSTISAQSGFREPHPVLSLGIGYASMVEDLGFGALGNIALPLAHSFQLSGSYRQLTFGEFGLKSFDLGCRFHIGNHQAMGLASHYFGNESAQFITLRSWYKRRLFQKLEFAVQARVQQQRITSYDLSYFASVDLGLYSQPIPKLYIGVQTHNAFPLSINQWENAFLHASAKYHISEKVRLYVSLLQYFTDAIQIGTGLYYQISDHLDMTASFYPQAQAFSVGIGINLSESSGIRMASLLHNRLPFSLALGGYYQTVKP